MDGLRTDGFTLACVTNKSDRFAIRLLQTVSLLSSFEVVITPDNIARPKPHPDLLVAAVARTGANVDAAIMVGDSTNDVRAALAAKCGCICITRDPDARIELLREGADTVLDDLSSLKATLRSKRDKLIGRCDGVVVGSLRKADIL